MSPKKENLKKKTTIVNKDVNDEESLKQKHLEDE